MTNRISFAFRVRDKGGPSSAKTLTQDIPDFDWTNFKNAPNAEEFVKKAYYASVKKIIREIDEKKNGSVISDLSTIESIIARSLTYTKDEINEWIKTRDWDRANQVKDMGKLLPILKLRLPTLAARKNDFSDEESSKLADKVIAAVADTPDPIADFLFTILTQSRTEEDSLFINL